MDDIELYRRRRRDRLINRMHNAGSQKEAKKLAVLIYKTFFKPYRTDDDVNWITMENGVHVPISKSTGTAVGGPVKGQDLSGATSQSNSSSSSQSSGSSTTQGANFHGAVDTDTTYHKNLEAQDAFYSLDPAEQCAFLQMAGVVEKNEYERLLDGAMNGDESALTRIDELSGNYFYPSSYSFEAMPVDCEKRDWLQGLPETERDEWIHESLDRNLDSSELGWANDHSNVQKMVCDLELNGTPQVLCEEDFNKYVSDTGAPVIYRGVKDTAGMFASNMDYELLYDPQKPYVGDGISGDGLYFSTSEETAKCYARENPITTCAIRQDAKFVDYDDPELQAYHKKLGVSDYDITASALALGYDGIKKPRGHGEDYYVVLNRAALIAKDNMEPYKDAMIEASRERSNS